MATASSAPWTQSWSWRRRWAAARCPLAGWSSVLPLACGREPLPDACRRIRTAGTAPRACAEPPFPRPAPPQACTTLQAQPGLLELLAFLRARGAKVGLVTRNTPESLNAFFAGGRQGAGLERG